MSGVAVQNDANRKWLSLLQDRATESVGEVMKYCKLLNYLVLHHFAIVVKLLLLHWLATSPPRLCENY